MKRKLLIIIIVVLLLGTAATVFALTHSSGNSEIEACPITPQISGC